MLKLNLTNFILKNTEDAQTKTDRKLKSGTMNMTVMVAGVAGGFFVLIIAIIIVCILMRNIQRNSAKKAAENEQRLAQNGNQDTVSACNLTPDII